MTDERTDRAGRERWAALAGTSLDEFDQREDRRPVLAGYAADGVCTGACPTTPDDAPDSFVDEAVAAVEEWAGRREPLDRSAFDDLRRRFAREPGHPAVPAGDDGGRSPHLREVDADELGAWVADTDAALVDLDGGVRFADLHGVPLDEDRYVPLVVAVDGLFQEAARDFHTHFHALERVRDRLDGRGRVLTDGGPEDLDDADQEKRDLVEEYVRTHPEASAVTTVLGALVGDGVTPADRDLVREVLAEYDRIDSTETSASHRVSDENGDIEGRKAGSRPSDPQGSDVETTPTNRDWADEVGETPDIPEYPDSTLDGETIRDHYNRIRDAVRPLGDLDQYPTLGNNDKVGWYITRDNTDVEEIRDGWDKRRRPALYAHDYDTLVDRADRTLYALSSYKDPAVRHREQPATLVRDDDGARYEYRDDKPTPAPEDLRAVAVWGDIDLADQLKPQRHALDDDTRRTAETALDAYVEEYARLFGGRDAVYVLDSVGGAYIMGAPEATLPISDHFEDDATRALVLQEVISRSNDWLADAEERVNDRVEAAAETVHPDWANNHNRQYKAPLSIHADHDGVVTPIDAEDVTYEYTPVEDVDEDLVDRTREWCESFTAADHTDRVETLVAQLWPDEYAEADGWREALDEWVEAQREAEQKRADLEQRAEVDRDDEVAAGLPITPNVRELQRALDGLDIEHVAEKTIVDQWTDRAPGLTDRSGSGKRAFVPTWAGTANSGNANYINTAKGTWVDTGDGGYGGPVELALIAAGSLGHARAEPVDGAEWAKGVEELQRLGFDLPVWTPDAETRTPEGDQYGEMPYWSLRRAAIALEVVDPEDLVERDGPHGTYQAFPDQETYRSALDAVEEAGLVHGRDRGGFDQRDRYETDPTAVDVVVEPRRAWDAARRVGPADLDDGADATLPTTDEGEAFACPCCGEEVGVVRAVAIDGGLVETCDATLAEEYAEAYRMAREVYGAPLPRYLTTADTVGEFEAVLGAIAEVSFWHLNRDALVCDITGEGDDVAGDAALTLDPTPVDGWRDSESGTSVLVYPSGTVYDADAGEGEDRGRALDVLRFVALDSGIIDDPTAPLAGSDFTTAYRMAREVYGAPLPRWYAAEADEAAQADVPLLPDAEVLLGDGAVLDGDTDDLSDVHERVEALVAEATDPETADTPTVVGTLPATGKTTSTIKRASEQPTTYLAPRKELQKQALDKARRWGVSTDILPVFGGRPVRDEAVDQAVAYVREHDKSALRDRWKLVEAVDGAVLVDEDDQEDDVDLPRATCDTADGEHGEAWALAVHVAHALDHSPRDIHVEGEALFGSPPPCACGDAEGGHDEATDHAGQCQYSAAWDRINDREAPADLLVGSYVHAHVEGARTYRTGTDDDPVDKPRAVVLDEYPGEAFGADYGPEAFDFAAWLARALSDDVDARADVTPALDGDEWVRAWLDGDVVDEFEGVRHAVDALGRRREVLRAADAAGRILDEVDDDDLDALGVYRPLSRLAEAWDDQEVRREAVRDLTRTLDEVRHGDPALGVARWVRDAVLDVLRDAVGPVAVDLDAIPAPSDGPLADVVRTALDMSAQRADGAPTVLRAAEAILRGGDDGARELALWDDDGYAHPDAAHLLRAIITPPDADRAARLTTTAFGYGGDGDTDEGTVLKQVATGDRTTVLVDENHQGATVLTPPDRATPAGDAPLVGLDATARADLWALSLGERVEVRDIHASPRERAEFLRDRLGITVVRMSDQARAYSGDASTKDTDGDVALIEHLADQYSGVYGPRGRDEGGVTVGKPAVVTSLGVEQLLDADDRLDGKVAEYAHYGALDGRNDLGDHRLAALLGSPHYGDRYVEKMAALAGEQVTTDRASGRGMALDYGSDVANAALRGMREDRVMQAILRFARGGSGAVVFARTAALREDLPVRAEGTVAKTYSRNASRIARAVATLGRGGDGERFTASDVVDELGEDAPSRRTVRRTLAEFATAGYVRRERDGDGVAFGYEHVDTPGAGEVDLPSVSVEGVDKRCKSTNYTAFVRVAPSDSLLDDAPAPSMAPPGQLPPPEAVATTGPPG